MSAATLPFADAAVSPGPPEQTEAVRRQIPSQRNRDVFASVAMGNSHAEAAQEFGLTQPRVTQIVRQVREWRMQVTGGELGEYNEVERLRLAEGTLRIQFENAIRLTMQEWRKSRQEGLGRATYVTTTMRLASNLARLSGVDTSGKTARLKAEQQAQEELELRRARAAEKPLWVEEPKTREWEGEPAASTPVPAKVCDEQPAPSPVEPLPRESIKNSYEPATSTPASNVIESIKDCVKASTPMVSVPCVRKPIPKFLDKKVRKRLLALRRQEARAETLGAVG